jgi:hypothetical protein
MIQADRRCFINVGMNSTLSLTKVSTIYPGIHYTDSHASLQPMSLTVCFPGKFPRQILERSDIVCIFINFPRGFLTSRR